MLAYIIAYISGHIKFRNLQRQRSKQRHLPLTGGAAVDSEYYVMLGMTHCTGGDENLCG